MRKKFLPALVLGAAFLGSAALADGGAPEKFYVLGADVGAGIDAKVNVFYDEKDKKNRGNYTLKDKKTIPHVTLEAGGVGHWTQNFGYDFFLSAGTRNSIGANFMLNFGNFYAKFLGLEYGYMVKPGSVFLGSRVELMWTFGTKNLHAFSLTARLALMEETIAHSYSVGYRYLLW